MAEGKLIYTGQKRAEPEIIEYRYPVPDGVKKEIIEELVRTYNSPNLDMDISGIIVRVFR